MTFDGEGLSSGSCDCGFFLLIDLGEFMLRGKAIRKLKSWHRTLARLMWQLRNGRAARSRAVYVLGAQRSGTTMLSKCFEQSPQFDVYGEKSRAFEDSRLKSLDTARNLIQESSRPFVLFKPLTDSHRAAELLSVETESKAIWMYRRPEDRANSAVNKFGSTNLEFLRELAERGAMNRWEACGVTPNSLALVRSLNPKLMDEYSAAATFWLLRNQLFFDQQLESNPSVLLVKYEALVTVPEIAMPAICSFLECEFTGEMISDIHAGSVGRSNMPLPSDVAVKCQGMLDELDRLCAKQWRSLGVEMRHGEHEGAGYALRWISTPAEV